MYRQFCKLCFFIYTSKTTSTTRRQTSQLLVTKQTAQGVYFGDNFYVKILHIVEQLKTIQRNTFEKGGRFWFRNYMEKNLFYIEFLASLRLRSLI